MPILEHWLVYLALSGPAATGVPPVVPDALEAKACRRVEAPPTPSVKGRARAEMPPVSASTQRKTSL
jgi:hypothetical protein